MVKTLPFYRFKRLPTIIQSIKAIETKMSNTPTGRRPDRLSLGLAQADVTYYAGEDAAGGLAHVKYWTADPETLSGREKQKAQRIQANPLHSRRFQPTRIIDGHEASGILDRRGRKQWVTLRLPDGWNRDLVVCGTPGLRNEYANEAVFMPWLLKQGYAVISGNKGLDNGWISMLSGAHPTRHWGRMMHDMARWAGRRLRAATGHRPRRIYAVGLSNGGYQVRRALEIDAAAPWWRRIFAGGLDWSGAYSPDVRVLDADADGQVDIDAYNSARTLVGQMDMAVRTMGWAYAPGTLTTPAQYRRRPRYANAHPAMETAGFSSKSDIFWGYYNINYDAYKSEAGLSQWRGVGYYNLTSYVYRAELLGHDLVRSAAYSCFYRSDPDNPDEAQHPIPPPLYAWLENAERGGWTPESIHWALANANTAVFNVPLITVVGDSDGLLPLHGHAAAYQQAVEKYGRQRLYRQYVIENAPHVDAHADGLVDFDFDGVAGDEGAANELTPLQPYAQRAFRYLIDWVERAARPPDSQIVSTDPTNAITDPDQLSW
jgi:hypothetical protein